MSDSRRVSGTVTTESDGRSRVAYDLMTRIAHSESDRTKDREYYLRLFTQCKMVVDNPFDLKAALELHKT